MLFIAYLMRHLRLLPLLLLAAFFVPGLLGSAVAATCSDYDTQAQAQHAADTETPTATASTARTPVSLQPAGQRRWRRHGWCGAAGNVATEDLVHMLDDLGIETGIDLSRLLRASAVAAEMVGHELPSAVACRGPRLGKPSQYT